MSKHRLAIMKKTKPELVDVCVIGAGAAGAVAAKKLGEAGFGVVVLEAGPRFNPITCSSLPCFSAAPAPDNLRNEHTPSAAAGRCRPACSN